MAESFRFCIAFTQTIPFRKKRRKERAFFLKGKMFLEKSNKLFPFDNHTPILV